MNLLFVGSDGPHQDLGADAVDRVELVAELPGGLVEGVHRPQVLAKGGGAEAQADQLGAGLLQVHVGLADREVDEVAQERFAGQVGDGVHVAGHRLLGRTGAVIHVEPPGASVHPASDDRLNQCTQRAGLAHRGP